MIPLLAALLSAPAAADPGPLYLTGGYEQVINDPFLVARGARAGVGYTVLPWLEAEVGAAVHPQWDRVGWTRTTRQLVDDYEVSPDLSPIQGRAHVLALAWPLSVERGALTSRLGALAGVGAVRTVDDLEAIDAVNDVQAEATWKQWHPATSWGLAGEIGGEATRLRVRLERSPYVETIRSTTDEHRRVWWVGSEVTWRL